MVILKGMETMKWLKLLLILPLMIIPGSPWIMKWLAQREGKKHLGHSAPDTHAIDDTSSAGQKLYYFHAPYCGPCKAIMPMIDALQQDYDNLIKIDITQNEELAKEFGVRATPTFVVVNNGIVREVKVGVKRESWLRSKLSGE